MELSTLLTTENQPIRYEGGRVYFLQADTSSGKSLIERLTKPSDPDFIKMSNLVVLVGESALERMRELLSTHNKLITASSYSLNDLEILILAQRFYQQNTVVLESRKEKDLTYVLLNFPHSIYVKRFIDEAIKNELVAISHLRGISKKRLYYGFVPNSSYFGSIPGNKRITGPKLRRNVKAFLNGTNMKEGHFSIPTGDLFEEFYFLTSNEKGNYVLIHYKKMGDKPYWVKYPLNNFIKDVRHKLQQEQRSVLLVIDSSIEAINDESIQYIARGRNVSKVIFEQIKKSL
ncbi:hypothetical protein HYW99_04175 [Candidatus Woesearchaeota archaeon]|nr:hypothetical protein [Candidatus Woesearchaeota archaeon]